MFGPLGGHHQAAESEEMHAGDAQARVAFLLQGDFRQQAFRRFASQHVARQVLTLLQRPHRAPTPQTRAYLIRVERLAGPATPTRNGAVTPCARMRRARGRDRRGVEAELADQGDMQAGGLGGGQLGGARLFQQLVGDPRMALGIAADEDALDAVLLDQARISMSCRAQFEFALGLVAVAAEDQGPLDAGLLGPGGPEACRAPKG